MSSSQGGKLRSNYRDLDSDSSGWGQALIGSNVVAGSFLPAAASGLGGASFFGGGLIMGSFASLINGSSFFTLSALGALSQFYGTGNLGVNTSGYRVIPINFMDFSGDGGSSLMVQYGLSATQALASVDSAVVVRIMKGLLSAQGTSGALFTSASQISVHFTYVALIVSNPG